VATAKPGTASFKAAMANAAMANAAMTKAAMAKAAAGDPGAATAASMNARVTATSLVMEMVSVIAVVATMAV